VIDFVPTLVSILDCKTKIMSVDALKKAEETQLKNIETSTGKTLEEWTSIVKNCGVSKHSELVNYLKKEHHLGHGNANMLVHYSNKTHSGFENEADLIAEQYKGKDQLKHIFDLLLNEIKSFGDDVEISPKKAYVSLRRKKQFAILQPSTKARLDVGLNLKSTETAGVLEAAGSWNSMCTHRIKIEQTTDVTPSVINWIRTAYEQA
jgi:predicted transport protein